MRDNYLPVARHILSCNVGDLWFEHKLTLENSNIRGLSPTKRGDCVF